MTRPLNTRAALIVVTLLAMMGFALRVFRLNVVPIRGDEFFTIVYWMRQPLATTLTINATSDPHPPLAYALYRGWNLLVCPCGAGAEEFVARILSVLFGVLGIPALYALGKRIGGNRVGLAAALVWTAHPFLIWHAQDARNYAVWSTLSALAIWLGLRALERSRRVDWLLYIAAAILAAYVYYLELFVLVVLSLYALVVYRNERRILGQWALALVVIGTALAPWYAQPRLLSGGYGGTTGGLQLEQLWQRFPSTLTFGTTLPGNVMLWLWAAVVLLFVLGLIALWQTAPRRCLLAALLALLPLALLSLVSLKLNVFTPRYVLGTAPAYTLAFAALVTSPRLARLRLPSALLLTGWLLLSGYSLYNHYFVSDYAKAPDWRSLVLYLQRYAAPDDIIIQAAADEALNFYYDTYRFPNDRKQLPANPTQSVEEIIRLLDADSQTHRSLWLVGQTFPDWQSAGVVERWTGEHMQRVRQTTVSGIRVEQHMPWKVHADEVSAAPLANFDTTVELVGARVLSPDETPGDLTLWLYWRPLETTFAPLKIFVHLMGAVNPATGNPLWSQDDQLPQDGRISTTNWQTDAMYRDVYILPLEDVPPGSYTLVTGIYNPATGERLQVDGGDSYSIKTVTIP